MRVRLDANLSREPHRTLTSCIRGRKRTQACDIVCEPMVCRSRCVMGCQRHNPQGYIEHRIYICFTVARGIPLVGRCDRAFAPLNHARLTTLRVVSSEIRRKRCRGLVSCAAPSSAAHCTSKALVSSCSPLSGPPSQLRKAL